MHVTGEINFALGLALIEVGWNKRRTRSFLIMPVNQGYYALASYLNRRKVVCSRPIPKPEGLRGEWEWRNAVERIGAAVLWRRVSG
jgi:hypothetical protein